MTTTNYLLLFNVQIDHTTQTSTLEQRFQEKNPFDDTDI